MDLSLHSGLPVRVTGSKHASYWLPILKNGKSTILKAIFHCQEPQRTDHQGNRFKWAVVRSPFSRLYSCWLDKVNTVRPRRNMLPAFGGRFQPGESSFECFVDWISSTSDKDSGSHWMSQDFILREQRFEPDIILRFESLQEDWQMLAELIGLNPSLERVNCMREDIAEHNFHVDAYTDSLRNKVAQRYRTDFERFGYDPGEL